MYYPSDEEVREFSKCCHDPAHLDGHCRTCDIREDAMFELLDYMKKRDSHNRQWAGQNTATRGTTHIEEDERR